MQDYDDLNNWLDQEPFAAYCLRVRDAIAAIGNASIADMQRHLGDDFNRKFHFDSLDRLQATGEIVQVSTVSPLRWAIGSSVQRKLPGRPEWAMRPRKPERANDAGLCGEI